jgi:hypothetical protein
MGCQLRLKTSLTLLAASCIIKWNQANAVTRLKQPSLNVMILWLDPDPSIANDALFLPPL